MIFRFFFFFFTKPIPIHQYRLQTPKSNCWVRLKSKLNHNKVPNGVTKQINSHVKLNTSSCQSQLAPDQYGSLTKGGAGVRPGNRWHNDETEALVLPTLDLHIIRLQGGRHHRAAAATPATAAYATGRSAARADSVERVLAPLWGPLAFCQARCLGAAVVRGGWWRGNVTFPFWHWMRRKKTHKLDIYVTLKCSYQESLKSKQSLFCLCNMHVTHVCNSHHHHLRIRGSCVWQWGWHGPVWRPAASAAPPAGETCPPPPCHPHRWAHRPTAGAHPHLLPRTSLCALCRSGKGEHEQCIGLVTFVKWQCNFLSIKQSGMNIVAL